MTLIMTVIFAQRIKHWSTKQPTEKAIENTKAIPKSARIAADLKNVLKAKIVQR